MSRPLRRRAFLAGSVAAAAALAGCRDAPTAEPVAAPGTTSAPSGPTSSAAPPTLSPAASRTPAAPTRPPARTRPADIAKRATVPVLCYHQLRDWRAGDSAYDRQVLICPPANFRRHLDALAAGGWTTISADAYLDHLLTGAALPPKPIVLSFDDSQGSQVSVGLPELVRRKMVGTFFVMTVALDKTGWMKRSDLRRLDAAGMTVAAHTWDHHRADRYAGDDWRVQLVEPRKELERIVGKPVRHFAYPYGAWAASDVPHLAKAGYRTGFMLGGKPDPRFPLFTLPRILVDSTWTGGDLLERLR